ncbi:MAG TPA: hypothetical protein VH740_10875 [Vicinamibacterales bacterium]|jgi:hypothetical protein
MIAAASRSIVVLLSASAIVAGAARAAEAQAWVPEQGEGSVSVLYQDLFVRNHLTADGVFQDNGHIQTNNLIMDVTYGVTDRLAVTAALPFIRTRYTGARPHPTVQDDGTPHSGFQDFRFGARYNLVDGPVAITPFIGTTIPSHGYEYFAHAAYGTRVRELEIGTYVAHALSAGLPHTFVQARYAFGFPQEIAGVSRHRSTLDVEVGYFVTPSIRVFTMGTGLKTHGGVDLPPAGYSALPPDIRQHHDRVARIESLDVGGGAQISVTKSIDLFGSFMRTIAGRNGHALSRGLTIGASWSFGKSGLAPLADADTQVETRTKESLIRCLCQK